MEVNRTEDRKIARDRCLTAMVECGDVETKRALWRAALRYNRREENEANPAQVIAGSLLATQ